MSDNLLNLILALLLVSGYMLPTVVAVADRHPHPGYVFILNIWSGWTGIGWLLLLVWAMWEARPVVVERTVVIQAPPRPVAEPRRANGHADEDRAPVGVTKFYDPWKGLKGAHD